MAESSILKTKRDGTLTLLDNGGANSYVWAFEQGNLKIDVPAESLVVTLDRGEFGSPPSVRKNNDQPITGSFTAHVRSTGDASNIAALQFILGGGYVDANWVSTLGANSEVPLWTLRYDIAGLTHGDAKDHRIDCLYTRITGSLQEGDINVVTCNFTSYVVYPTVT